MKSSVSAKLRNRPNKNGKYTVIVQVIIDRNSTELSTGIKIDANQWDAKKEKVKKHPRADTVNWEINNTISKIEEKIFKAKREGVNLTIDQVKLKPISVKVVQSQTENLTFSEYLEHYISHNPDELGIGTIKYYQTTLKNWKMYKPKGVKIDTLTTADIVGFRKYLINKMSNSTNTVYNKMKTVRKICKKLYSEGVISKYLFETISLKQVEGQRGYLTKTELQNLGELCLSDSRRALARDVFLFSAYTGLRFSDICKLQINNVIEGEQGIMRLKFRSQKNQSTLEFNLNNRAVAILRKYMSESQSTYAFPMLRKLVTNKAIEINKKIGSANASMNSILKDIFILAEIKKENISMHSGRHSYAVISIEMGADIYVLSKMLGHTSITTTEIYAKLVDKRKDELVKLWNEE